MQAAVLEFERPLCHRTAHPESPESNSCLKHLLAQRNGGTLARSCLSGLLGSKLIWVPVPQGQRAGKQLPGGGSCNKTHAPHGRQQAIFHFL